MYIHTWTDLAGAECSSLSDWSEIGHAEFKHFDLINIFKSTVVHFKCSRFNDGDGEDLLMYCKF